ncbi:hypothetical protein [Nitrososphaera sp.]|uniref:hypothetical protein n=1 Tax=Nitrososphaera sp. TaxID=1971748 RepID=UPI00307F3E3D
MSIASMFGFGVLLMAVADYLARRQHDRQRKCDVCRQKFENFESVEKHRREVHSNAPA